MQPLDEQAQQDFDDEDAQKENVKPTDYPTNIAITRARDDLDGVQTKRYRVQNDDRGDECLKPGRGNNRLDAPAQTIIGRLR